MCIRDSYIDRPNKILYFYPPCLPGDQNVSMSISVGTTEMVDLNGAHDISIFGLDFDTCRNTIVKSYNINRVEIDSCSFSLGASNAITLDGANSSVYRCHIYEMGKGGVIVKGGDRKTLTPANNEIWGNRIHSFNRIYESSAPAVLVSGVKQTIAYNTIYDAPHTMIQLVGANDTLIAVSYTHLFSILVNSRSITPPCSAAIVFFVPSSKSGFSLFSKSKRQNH